MYQFYVRDFDARKIKKKYDRDDHRSAILSIYSGLTTERDASAQYNVPYRRLLASMQDLKEVNQIRMQSGLQPLIEDEDRQQVTRWAILYCGATVVKNQLTTLYEKRMALLLDITKSKPFVFIKEEYGVSKSVHHRIYKTIVTKLLVVNQLKN